MIWGKIWRKCKKGSRIFLVVGTIHGWLLNLNKLTLKIWEKEKRKSGRREERREEEEKKRKKKKREKKIGKKEEEKERED